MPARSLVTQANLRPENHFAVREALFQGWLDFEWAIILLKDGCSEFSNIVGLTQIRFPKGNVMAQAEEIHRVLEREGILK
jgi:hypothetical protein